MSLQAQIAAARIFIGFIQAAPGEVNLSSFTDFAEATAFQRPLLAHVVYLKAVPGPQRLEVKGNCYGVASMFLHCSCTYFLACCPQVMLFLKEHH
jgi:hypothetical protein